MLRVGAVCLSSRSKRVMDLRWRGKGEVEMFGMGAFSQVKWKM